MSAQTPPPAQPRFADHPVLLFWETTRACLLACRHCRASAQPDPLPGQLDRAEGIDLLFQAAEFAPHPPVVVFTGGDVLLRPDLEELLAVAHSLRLVTAVSPSATDRLNERTLDRLAALGVHGLSVSIDAGPEGHDRLRGVEGTHARSVTALRAALARGLVVQVNTVVMRSTVADLPHVAATLVGAGVRVWEVFFLVATGRALASEYLTPAEVLDVCAFLVESTRYGIELRTVEAPFIRRVFEGMREGTLVLGPLYDRLTADLRDRLGPPRRPPHLARAGTLDGDGILFVAHDGTVHPGGLLPLPLGNVRSDRLVDVYRTHPVLQAIRARAFHGPCGECPARFTCGGSRARAYAATGDPLGTDPLCPWAAAAQDTAVAAAAPASPAG
ncbi:MAG: TIGR04053 family radical SAM/SPASM domain-containing protein [Firmicutes bacterium]|nr:TIGR04053 family radical SAM/SPASM domain-containing protein [Bacillota bacterium]